MGTQTRHLPVSVKQLHTDAKLPTYGSVEAAGADLYAVFYRDDYATPPTPGQEAIAIGPGERRLIKTGIALELTPGFEAQIRPRSGLALRHGITVLNTPGTIDSDYRGDVGVILLNTSNEVFYVNPGDRIAQLVIAPIVQGRFGWTGGEISETMRGAGGFGSTGTA